MVGRNGQIDADDRRWRASQLLDLAGRLFGVPHDVRKKRANELMASLYLNLADSYAATGQRDAAVSTSTSVPGRSGVATGPRSGVAGTGVRGI